jgi:uncharacterized membrane protein HdeD (DUF308 family)
MSIQNVDFVVFLGVVLIIVGTIMLIYLLTLKKEKPKD